jgi:hypothetical protein
MAFCLVNYRSFINVNAHKKLQPLEAEKGLAVVI